MMGLKLKNPCKTGKARISLNQPMMGLKPARVWRPAGIAHGSESAHDGIEIPMSGDQFFDKSHT